MKLKDKSHHTIAIMRQFGIGITRQTFSRYKNFSLVRSLQSPQKIKQCGLSRTARPHYDTFFSSSKLQRNSIENPIFSKRFTNFFKPNKRTHYYKPLSRKLSTQPLQKGVATMSPDHAQRNYHQPEQYQ